MNKAPRVQRPPKAPSKGFTLIEVLLVVFIIGILSTLAIPHLRHAHYKGRATKIVEDLRIIRNSLLSYHLDKGTWPRSRSWGRLPRGTLSHLPAGISFDLSSWETEYKFNNYANKSQSWRDKRGYAVILQARVRNIELANVVASLAPNMFDIVRINRKRGLFIIILS